MAEPLIEITQADRIAADAVFSAAPDFPLTAKLHNTVSRSLARHRLAAEQSSAKTIAELTERLREATAIINEGVSVEISEAELRNAHPEDRRFIKRTRAALDRIDTTLAKLEPRP